MKTTIAMMVVVQPVLYGTIGSDLRWVQLKSCRMWSDPEDLVENSTMCLSHTSILTYSCWDSKHQSTVANVELQLYLAKCHWNMFHIVFFSSLFLYSEHRLPRWEKKTSPVHTRTNIPSMHLWDHNSPMKNFQFSVNKFLCHTIHLVSEWAHERKRIERTCMMRSSECLEPVQNRRKNASHTDTHTQNISL